MSHHPHVPFRTDPALQAFRGEARASLGLHPLEKTLLIIVGIHLCFTPWALGTMHVWSQFVSLGLAVAGFAVAIVNRSYTGDHAHEGAFKLVMWPKLVRFPIFWLGLALLGYVLAQALNPSWAYATNAGKWWLVPLQHVTWLPTGIEAPFAKMNAWRALMLYATPWLVACAVWMGFTRRATVQRLFILVVANGAVLALVGILQRVTHAHRILWGLKGYHPNGGFFSTIIYKNHAGAYFNLVLMLGGALFYWYFARAERRLERTSPAPVFAFLCILLGIAVLLTFSRAATFLLIGFALIGFIGFIVRCATTRGEGRSPLAIGLLCVVFTLFIGCGAYFLNLNKSFDRLGRLIERGTDDFSVSSRLAVRQAAMEMAEDNLVTGWGAGSFRYMFPAYQRRYPEIYMNPRTHRMLGWNDAHNDYVELLDELGLIGVALFLAMLVCWGRHLWRHRIYLRPPLMVIVLALAVTLAHAFVDFPANNPAIVLLWCTSAVLLGRWTELESRRDDVR